MSNYQIYKTNTNEANFNLKYKVFEWREYDSEMDIENSIFLKKEGRKFIKYAGNLQMHKEDISSLLNKYFNNYKPGKKLITEENIYV